MGEGRVGGGVLRPEPKHKNTTRTKAMLTAGKNGLGSGRIF